MLTEWYSLNRNWVELWTTHLQLILMPWRNCIFMLLHSSTMRLGFQTQTLEMPQIFYFWDLIGHFEKYHLVSENVFQIINSQRIFQENNSNELCACWWPGTIRCKVICRISDDKVWVLYYIYIYWVWQLKGQVWTSACNFYLLWRPVT